MTEIFCQQCRKSKKAELFPSTSVANNSRRHCNACIDKAAKRPKFKTEEERIERTNAQSAAATAMLEKFLKRTGNL